MLLPITMRRREPNDDGPIDALLTAAFGGEAEAVLVRALRDGGEMAAEFVAHLEGEIVGHVAFSRLDVRAGLQSLRAAALAPLAVAPPRQRRGIGEAITRHGIDWLRHEDYELIVVLGHPAYYPRFGFSSLLAKLLDAPFFGESFMALELKAGILEARRWRVTYAEAFGVTH